MKAARRVIADLEQQWARVVGEDQFAAFLETLAALEGIVDPAQVGPPPRGAPPR